MADVKSATFPIREEELRQAIELLYFAYRDFTAEPDAMLERYGFGRAHHRVIYFVGRHPHMSVSDLLTLLRITKQSLARVLTVLIQKGYVAQSRGRSDGRQRLLSLTEEGQALERRLFERQRERLASAYREAGAPAVEGFRRVMRGIMDDEARALLDRAPPARRKP
jgi:DNA-binding MarR family transcriptional regulator